MTLCFSASESINKWQTEFNPDVNKQANGTHILTKKKYPVSLPPPTLYFNGIEAANVNKQKYL